MVTTSRMLAVSISLLAATSTVCSTSRAASPSPVGQGSETGAPGKLAPPAQDADQALAQATAGAASPLPAQPPREGARCLQGGAACNPLDDRCCPGYYCFGGLVPTCFRKP